MEDKAITLLVPYLQYAKLFDLYLLLFKSAIFLTVLKMVTPLLLSNSSLN